MKTIRIAVAALALAMAIPAMAQSKPPEGATLQGQVTTPKKAYSSDKLKLQIRDLQNAILQNKLSQRDYVDQYNALEQKNSDLSKQGQALIDQLYKNENISPDDYDFDLATLTFKLKTKPAKAAPAPKK